MMTKIDVKKKLWVCRTGKKGSKSDLYLNKVTKDEKIVIPWNGFDQSFSLLRSRQDFKNLVIREKGNPSETAINTWAGQLYSFCNNMKVGDYVLIPRSSSNYFHLAIIKGNYSYDSNDSDGIYHSRKIEFLAMNIPNNIFTQQTRYSLGAFRTVFQVKNSESVLSSINDWLSMGGNK